MSDEGFGGWLRGLHAIVVDDGSSCERPQAWLLDAGAMTTHTNVLEQALELLKERSKEFDLVIVDADAHAGWQRLADDVAHPCSILVMGADADAERLHQVVEQGAGYLSSAMTRADFVFGVHRLVALVGPPLGHLAARGARLWGLSPRFSRLLHYNLWGYSDRDIADALSISIKTAQQYQEELRRRTGVKTKQSYLRRLLTLAGQEPLLPPTDHSSARVERDRELLPRARWREDG